jgi:hypothetical protein
MAQIEDAHLLVRGALIEDSLLTHRSMEGLKVCAFTNLKRIDAASMHEKPLIPQHLANRAHLSAIAKPLA